MNNTIAGLIIVICMLAAGQPAYAESPCATVYRYDRATLDALAQYYTVARARKATMKDLRPALDAIVHESHVFGNAFNNGSEDDGDVDSKFAACDPETRFVNYDASLQMYVAIGRVEGALSASMLKTAVFFLGRMVALGNKTGQSDSMLPDLVHRLQGFYQQQHLSQPPGLIDVASQVDSQTTASPTVEDTPTPEPTP